MDPSTRERGLIAGNVALVERLLTTVGVGVVVADMRADDTPIAYANPAFERITGYSAQAAIGHSWCVLLGEATDPVAVAELRAALAAGDAYTGTLLAYRRDGTPFWSELRLAPVLGAGHDPAPGQRNDDGPLYYLGLLSDVSDRVRAQSELVGAEALRSSVFNAISGGIMVIDGAGTLLDVNPAAMEILGVDRAWLERPGWWEALDVRDAGGPPVFGSGAARPAVQAIRENRSILSQRMLMRRGDGAQRLYSMNYVPLTEAPGKPPHGVVISFWDMTETERTARDAELFAALVANSSDFVGIADLDGTVRYVNDAGLALVGLESLDEARARRPSDFLTEEANEQRLTVQEPAVAADGRWEGESSLRHFKTGAEIPVLASTYLVHHPDTDEPWARATVQRDISERRGATAELIASREQYEALFRSLPLPTYVWRRRDDDYVLVEWNAAAEEITHGGVRDIAGVRASALHDGEPEILLGFERCWSTTRPVTVEQSYRMRTTDELHHFVTTFAFVPPDVVLVHTLDVTERVAIEQRLRAMAERDDVTDLYNRRYLERRLGEALGNGDVALAIVDVDHFKFVNDSLGHDSGDEVLREVAGAMRARLRDDDVLARFSGDEFAVLLADTDSEHAWAVAGHLLAAIRASVTLVSITASAGLATFERDSTVTASDAVVAADIALHSAKQSGRDRVALYDGQAGARLTWLERIRQAIADERLVLHGQPILNLATGRAEMYELLVRMTDEQGAIIPPSSFLPTAEQFGAIRDIDRWVVARGIEFAARGHRVSINLSARSLGDPGLVERIAGLLQRTGVSPELVNFEFTETAAVSSIEDALAVTRGLLEIGCETALDDIGTGFGTFMLLKHLPVSTLKIDMEFVRELSTSTADQRIVRGIVRLAADAGMKTVAEGVQDAGALALLREYGVDFAQGYHIGRPAPLPA